MPDLKAAANKMREIVGGWWSGQESREACLLAAQALEALAWAENQKQPIECVLGKWRILGRDQYGHLKYYHADTPLGALLAATKGERNG